MLRFLLPGGGGEDASTSCPSPLEPAPGVRHQLLCHKKGVGCSHFDPSVMDSFEGISNCEAQ